MTHKSTTFQDIMRDMKTKEDSGEEMNWTGSDCDILEDAQEDSERRQQGRNEIKGL